HFLLWKIGVAHGDISFNNLMVKSLPNGNEVMVLNDYDLAVIMVEGEKSPSKKGDEITGTSTFMAIDLLFPSDGSVFHLYRHDLKSILWCIAWYCKEEKRWTEGSHNKIAKEKASWLLNVNPACPPDDIRPGAEVFWRPVIKTFRTWINARMARIECKADHTERELMEMIDQHLPCQEEYKTWDWMDFSVYVGVDGNWEPCYPGTGCSNLEVQQLLDLFYAGDQFIIGIYGHSWAMCNWLHIR
ncbi:hypothetical protein FA15DRAFT_661910, partial [Coprinopsis marcescibilis]